MIRVEGSNLFFDNDNNLTYVVVQYNPILQVAILRPLSCDSYILVKGIKANGVNWGTGSYNLSYEEALKGFNDYIGRA